MIYVFLNRSVYKAQFCKFRIDEAKNQTKLDKFEKENIRTIQKSTYKI